MRQTALNAHREMLRQVSGFRPPQQVRRALLTDIISHFAVDVPIVEALGRLYGVSEEAPAKQPKA